MPMAKTKTLLSSKFAGQIGKAWEETRELPPELSNFDELPAIENGVAKLVDCRFDQFKTGDNKDEWFFRAEGVIVYPEYVTHEGQKIKVAGRRTSIQEPLCDTPTRSRATVKDHVSWVKSQFQLLGVDTSAMTEHDLEPTAEALKQMSPAFSFSVRIIPKRKPGEPGYNAKYDGPDTPATRFHNWTGLTEYVDGGGDGVTDETAAAPPKLAPKAALPPVKRPTAPPPSRPAPSAPAAATRTVQKAAPPPVKAQAPVQTKPPVKAQTPPPKKAPVVEEPVETYQFDEFGDIDSLVALAGDDSQPAEQEAAQKQLTEMALNAGLTQDDVDNIPDWVTLGETLKGAEQGGEGDEGEPTAEEEFKPQEQNVYFFAPLGKDKKPVKKPVECECVSVDEEAQTVTLKNLNDPKQVYKDVPWDKLMNGE